MSVSTKEEFTELVTAKRITLQGPKGSLGFFCDLLPPKKTIFRTRHLATRPAWLPSKF